MDILTTEEVKKRIGDLKVEQIIVSGYEKILKITSLKAKLKAIIAIHDTTLGLALGGIRIYPYKTFDDALTDVLRLSEGMTYKAAVAEVGLGGGKSVIIADPKIDKTDELLLAFGEAVESLKGEYVCAEDLGCTLKDVKTVASVTKYVTGLPHSKSSGNPSRFTAYGVFQGILASAKFLFGSSDLEGKTVAIQGLGSVGRLLMDQLFWAGANVIVSDVNADNLHQVEQDCNAKIVSSEEIYKVKCDIFVPCAIGGIVNEETIKQFNCKAIAGCANNQLLKPEDANLLKEKNILYAPDFVINAGGLLNVTSELDEEGYNPAKARKHTSKIFDTLMSIFEISKNNNVSTYEAAISLAKHKLKFGIGKRQIPPYFHHAE